MSASHAAAAQPQALVLALLRRVPDYKFDGNQVADWLIAHRDLWLAAAPMVLQNGPLLTGLYGGTFEATGLLVMCLAPAADIIKAVAVNEWGAVHAHSVSGPTAQRWSGFTTFPNLAIVSISWVNFE